MTLNNIYTQIQPGLYLGGSATLGFMDDLRAQNIRAVLRMDRVNLYEKPSQWADDFTVMYLPIQDGVHVGNDIFETATEFIHQQVSSGRKILVHCQMGMSRSTTMVLAYLIQYEGLSLAQAYRRVYERRSIVFPHPRLMESLVNYYGLPYTPQDINRGYDFLEKLLNESQL